MLGSQMGLLPAAAPKTYHGSTSCDIKAATKRTPNLTTVTKQSTASDCCNTGITGSYPSTGQYASQISPVLNVHGSVHRKNILIYIQQDATLHSLFYLGTPLHVSGGTTTHHQERKQLYLQHLVFVTPLELCSTSSTIAAGSSNGVTNTSAVDTVVCASGGGWWYHPKYVEQFPDKIDCVTLHLYGYREWA